MQLYDCDAISDPEIRAVYADDIVKMSHQVQQRFGIMPFLFEGNLANVTGFYEFTIFRNEKRIVSAVRTP